MLSSIFSKVIKPKIFYPSILRTFSSGPDKVFTREELKNNGWRLDYGAEANQWTHKSDARMYMEEVPVIKVNADRVRCQGGSSAELGHPAVYIQ